MFTPPVGAKRRSRYRGPMKSEDHFIGVESIFSFYFTGACPVGKDDCIGVKHSCLYFTGLGKDEPTGAVERTVLE